MAKVLQSLLLVLILSPQLAFACRCVEPSSEMAFNNAAVVIQATVEDVIDVPEGNGLSAVLKVSKAWKKTTTDKIIVNSLTSCYYPFEKDKTYILFLNIEPDGLYSTGRCFGNQALSEAKDLPAWLDAQVSK